MIVYVPTLITSVEQAESLPEGTVVRWGTDGVGVVLGDGEVQVFGEGAARPVETLIRWTALAPVEAEEVIGTELRHQLTDRSYEIHVMRSTDMDNARWQIKNNPDYATGRIMRHYRTPWEPVSGPDHGGDCA